MVYGLCRLEVPTSPPNTTIALNGGSEQEFFEELGAPCGFLPFADETSLRSVSLEQTNYELSKKAKILGAVPVAKSTFVLVEHDVQNPMHALDRPMTTD